MMRNQLFRFIHSAVPTWSSVSKSHLSKLRKKTGYTFSNCKKALEINNNDLAKAEKWLQDQAQALGWSKLSKLEGRVTAQGLVGVTFEGKKAALVEINCETDFVARNKYFKEMMNIASTSCLQYIKKIETSKTISKDWFDSEQLKMIEGPEGKKLSDHVALLVSNVGENVTLRRAVGVGVKDKVQIACYVHPDHSEATNVMSGKYGAVIMYTALKNDVNTGQLVRQLCQHIIGMNPKRIQKDPEELIAQEEAVQTDTSETVNAEEKEEDALMHQDFLLDPSLSVQELLAGTGIVIHDFVRFETGEKIVQQDIPEPEVKASQMGG